MRMAVVSAAQATAVLRLWLTTQKLATADGFVAWGCLAAREGVAVTSRVLCQDLVHFDAGVALHVDGRPLHHDLTRGAERELVEALEGLRLPVERERERAERGA